MSVYLSHILLTVYRWGGIVLAPFLSLYLLLKGFISGKKDSRRAERLGYSSAMRPVGPLIWFHAVSIGETIALIELIREIRRRKVTVLLTTKTISSAILAQKRLGQEVIHQYAPFDVKPALSRFLNHWKPDCVILSESEIWPLSVCELAKKRIPQILVNARMSSHSFKNWCIFPSLSEKIFSKLSLAVVQSEASYEIYRQLGIRELVVSGNLKVDVGSPPCDATVLSTYRQQIGERYTWAAISTFEGEEDVAVYVHEKIASCHNILTIIVPRHPERCDAIEKNLLSKGLKVARHTRGDALSSDIDVFLGDTIGEMGLYLRMTEIAFVGRSLFSKGGQNPLEPAMLGCAIISGPNIDNFRDIYQKLASSESACIVQDAEKLANIVHLLLSKPRLRYKMINNGMSKVEEMQGALEITLRALEPYINPLIFQARLLPRRIRIKKTKRSLQ
ncbi:lipid IV(A) 3-deoxy-D-manno-octulosonic acid transferase [Candidatus Liberibacter sp.]|uniref:lipid IV(A) 3-deoxy-D-manno-octulosonic acid transferase n=1 Tax=Candidatus Liberibacter sp. TaxID=34022 RepID=UPI0015F48B63|nr:lipid IV(A) 3-deoxy-D-manno-octulosonic acid transferase [Candidatus Liberibacter sp.]MBA5724220.1 lipid IV(A) 3-deoxy-D-manno-octulosonic acid transferase [Candidatus Liberibacter sp.]